MEIVYVNSARDWGGAEHWSLEFATGLAERGHRVAFVCHPGGVLYRRLQADSRVELVPLRIRGELDPVRIWRLSRIFRRVDPDLVVVYRTRDTKLGVMASWLAGGYAIVQAHKSPFPLRDNAQYRLLWTRGVRAMAVSSGYMRVVLLENAPWLEQIPIRVIYNGVDTGHYRPLPRKRAEVRAELGIPPDAFAVSYHGRIERRKRVDVVIESIARASEEVAVHGLVVGEGGELDEYRRLAEARDATIHFTGFRRDVPRLLSAADAALHLSISDTLPHSVLEAMACGLPAIVSDAASHTEQVEHGVHGLVVAAGDPEATGRAIVRLARDPGLRNRMGRAARERAVREFDRGRMVAEYESYLLEVLQGLEGETTHQKRR